MVGAIQTVSALNPLAVAGAATLANQPNRIGPAASDDPLCQFLEFFLSFASGPEAPLSESDAATPELFAKKTTTARATETDDAASQQEKDGSTAQSARSSIPSADPQPAVLAVPLPAAATAARDQTVAATGAIARTRTSTPAPAARVIDRHTETFQGTRRPEKPAAVSAKGAVAFVATLSEGEPAVVKSTACATALKSMPAVEVPEARATDHVPASTPRLRETSPTLEHSDAHSVPKEVAARVPQPAPAEHRQDHQAHEDYGREPVSKAEAQPAPANRTPIPTSAAATVATNRGETHNTHSADVAPRHVNADGPEPSSFARGSAPVRQFVLSLPSSVANRVEVHLAECAGRVRVTVRSSDPHTTEALRSELGNLVRTVTNKGMRIETWTPPETHPFAATGGHDASAGDGDPGAFHPDHSGRQQHQQDTAPDDQRRKHEPRADWLAELEERLGKD